MGYEPSARGDGPCRLDRAGAVLWASTGIGSIVRIGQCGPQRWFPGSSRLLRDYTGRSPGSLSPPTENPGAVSHLSCRMTDMTASPQLGFTGPASAGREHWRSIVLFGRNVASYKFALAKALLELSGSDRELVPLEDLAVPFANHLCEHIARVDRQGTFAHSRFLDACRFYNAGAITADELRDTATVLGFANVIDAFHVVGSGEVPTRFFLDERNSSGGIRLTDGLFELAATSPVSDLLGEAESRWRLVESAWDARAEGRQVTVLYDAPRELLVPALRGKRRPITEIRPALNGYQKGHCFYCFRAISFTSSDPEQSVDVDHFFPHSLMARGFGVDLDMPWNLVLACTTCNRGPAGKFAALPDHRYLDRLHRRNEFLIASHHPLRDTLLLTTGPDPTRRRRFLLDVATDATQVAGTTAWRAPDEDEPRF